MKGKIFIWLLLISLISSMAFAYSVISQSSVKTLNTADIKSENYFFSELLYNHATAGSGTAIFKINNQIDNFNLKDLDFSFYKLSGQGIVHYDFYILKNVSYNVPVYEESLIPKPCPAVPAPTNGSKPSDAICGDKKTELVGYETKYKIVETRITNDYHINKGVYLLKLKAYWLPRLGKQAIEWFPEVYIKKTDYPTLNKDYYYKHLDWAWWNTSYDRKAELLKVPEYNISYLINGTGLFYGQKVYVNPTQCSGNISIYWQNSNPSNHAVVCADSAVINHVFSEKAYYTFDNNFSDISGNGKHLTAYNDVALSSSGVLKNSSSFTDTDARLRAAAGWFAGTNHTMAFWLNPDVSFCNGGASDYVFYMYNAGVGGTNNAGWGCQVTGAQSGFYEGTAWLTYSGASGYIEQSWNYYVHTSTTTTQATFFRNATKMGDLTFSPAKLEFDNEISISMTGDSGSDQQFMGYMDELRVYNRGLSDSEAPTLYYNYRGLNVTLGAVQVYITGDTLLEISSLKSLEDNTGLQKFNVTVLGKQYNVTTGSLIINLTGHESEVDIILNIPVHFQRVYNDWNTSIKLNATAIKWPGISTHNIISKAPLKTFNVTLSGGLSATAINYTVFVPVNNTRTVTFQKAGYYGKTQSFNFANSADLNSSLTEWPTITAYDSKTLDALKTFNVTPESGVKWTATNYAVKVPVNNSDNLTFQKAGYHTKTVSFIFTNQTNLNTTLETLYYFMLTNYSGFVNKDGRNYTRNLSLSYNATCPSSGYTTTLWLYDDGVKIKSLPITCSNTTIAKTTSYKPGSEGYYNLTFLLNTTFAGQSHYYRNDTFYSDLYDPEAIAGISLNSGFSLTAGNGSLYCADTATTPLTYNLSINGKVYYYGVHNRTFNQTNSTSLVDGNNIVYGVCKDYFGDTNDTFNMTVYKKVLWLIDEIENDPFDVKNLSIVKVYFDDNSSQFNFKTTNQSNITFLGKGGEKLRFEFGVYDYNDDVLLRYVDLALVNTSNVRVCVNKVDVVHYDQYIISASSGTRAVLKNVYSNCVVAADYTRFAYQNSYMLKAYTINSLYYLYTYDNDDRQTMLSSIDGSLETYYNVDVLEFNKGAINLNVLSDTLAFQKTATGQVKIYYKNDRDDNTDLRAVITRLDTDAVVLNTTDFADKNEFTLYFDYSTLLGITNSTLFKMQLFKTNDGGESSTLTKYFNVNGKSGTMNSSVAFVIAFLLTIFGFTFTVSKVTFGWFGIIICLASIGLLTFAISAWYITFLIVLNVIILAYSVIVMINQNPQSLSG